VAREPRPSRTDHSRGHFAAAARAAKTGVSSNTTGQIREAAALILDEIDWIEGRETPLRSKGATPNIELTDRHRLLRARRGLAHDPIQSGFYAALIDWETREIGRASCRERVEK